ncbi:Pectate lyase [Bertholletia excelsa]
MVVMNQNAVFFFFFLSFAVMSEALHGANTTAETQEYWKKRRREAREAALDSYHPNPEKINNHLIEKVHESITGANRTRRKLRRYKGPCMATNPIDRCWRCRTDWMDNRQNLADCALGFGRNAIGGKNGMLYVVTDPSDNDVMNPLPGTLRHAVIQEEPLWIIFARSMIITLSQELMIYSHKTIDGRGANVHIAHGAGFTIQFVRNVIIHGIHFHHVIPTCGGLIRDSVHHMGFRTRSDGDGISIFGSSDIWIDHVSLSNCADGLIDIIFGSTGITISNCHFARHNDVLLLGANKFHFQDKLMQVTVAFNHFGKGCVQRMPRCRHGFIHVVNNDYTHWLMYAIGGSDAPTIISQGNRFIAPPNPAAKEVTKRDYATPMEWSQWQWRSEGDLMMEGAFFVESGPPLLTRPFSTMDMITAKPGTYVSRLTRFAGPLGCKKKKPC